MLLLCLISNRLLVSGINCIKMQIAVPNISYEHKLKTLCFLHIGFKQTIIIFDLDQTNPAAFRPEYKSIY